ncbi:MAG: SH3 domain-containing protein [Longimicrobiales bacterium]
MRSLPPTLAALLLFSVGCAQPAPAPAPQAPVVMVDTVSVTRVDTVRVETPAAADPALQDRVARLQIQLLERDVQLQELQEQLASTRLELVRNMARLQTQASRAEAASGMAEAEIALGTLRRGAGSTSLPELTQAEDLFRQSSSEFASDNYGGALYLATQVRALVRTGQARLQGRGNGALAAGESLFAVPVPLRTTGRTNVRSGPGTTFAVVFTLDPSVPVTGQSYTSQWVRVVDDQRREGWIFNTLVTSR